MNLPRGGRCGNAHSGPVPGSDLYPDHTKTLLGRQMLLILVVGVAYLIAKGHFQALSAMYGGAMAVLNTWMLARRVRFATKTAKSAPGLETGALYRGAIQRFGLVFALFIIGIAILSLEPVPLLLGFAVPQGAFLLVRKK